MCWAVAVVEMLRSTPQKFNNYVGIGKFPANNVQALQKTLNKIPGSDTLTEDGVYGEKTSNSYNLLIDELLHGSFPMLTYVDPLQSAHTGIYVKPKITK